MLRTSFPPSRAIFQVPWMLGWSHRAQPQLGQQRGRGCVGPPGLAWSGPVPCSWHRASFPALDEPRGPSCPWYHLFWLSHAISLCHKMSLELHGPPSPPLPHSTACAKEPWKQSCCPGWCTLRSLLRSQGRGTPGCALWDSCRGHPYSPRQGSASP